MNRKPGAKKLADVPFDYSKAYSRNLGLLSMDELQRLKDYRVAIPGMGGVGGVHLINSVRMGLSNFKIADLDLFGIENFNRQYGANIHTIDHAKTDVMKRMALDINPQASIEAYGDGVTRENMDDFLSNVDLVIDGLDFFSVKVRRNLINESLKRGIPVITSGPIGMGTAYVCFKPGGPNFDELYMVNEQMSEQEMLLHFIVGLSPKLLHVKYLMQEYVSLKEKRVPSLNPGVYLAAGVAGVEAIKILLKRGRVFWAPFTHQFDVYTNRYACVKVNGLLRTPLQKLKVQLIKIKYKDLL